MLGRWLGLILGLSVSVLIVGTGLLINALLLKGFLMVSPALIPLFLVLMFISVWIHIWLSPFFLAVPLISFALGKFWPQFRKHTGPVLLWSVSAAFAGLCGESMLWLEERPKCPDAISSWFCLQIQFLYDADPYLMGISILLAGALGGAAYSLVAARATA